LQKRSWTGCWPGKRQQKEGLAFLLEAFKKHESCLFKSANRPLIVFVRIGEADGKATAIKDLVCHKRIDDTRPKAATDSVFVPDQKIDAARTRTRRVLMFHRTDLDHADRCGIREDGEHVDIFIAADARAFHMRGTYEDILVVHDEARREKAWMAAFAAMTGRGRGRKSDLCYQSILANQTFRRM